MVMLQNKKTTGFVVMDIGERVQNVEEGYTVTCTSAGQNPGPMTRSVFRVVKEDSVDMFTSDEFVRYGQKLRIEANEHLFKKRLQLSSAPQTATVCAALSGKQIAFVNAARPNANGLWRIDHCDPNIRFEMQGEIVKAGEPVLIRHVGTCVYLAADPTFKVKNDFGSENEMHCQNHSSKNKSQNLALEQAGRLTVDVPTKFQLDNNVFMFCCAPDESYSRPIDELAKLDINVLMGEIKQKLFERSSFGLRHLARIFKAMD
jgi:hypothetical protein